MHRDTVPPFLERLSELARKIVAMHKSLTHSFVLCLFFAVVVQAVPFALGGGAALACGGFFCSSINLVPIEQNAERILFEVNTDGKSAGTVTVTVEISYTGSPADFSWVLPVSDLVGELSVAPPQALQLLDDVTSPRIIPPPTTCNEGLPLPFFGFSESSARGLDIATSAGPVSVETLDQVGPYAPQLVSSDDASALITWLTDNDYLITPEMEPAVADYVSDGMKFLAMKLAPEAEVADIAPIQITYPGDEPMVPLVLTSVAAEPEMGVMVLIAAQGRYESANYANFEVDSSMVEADPTNGESNYYPLVSWQIDDAGGQAMVTEFVDSSDVVFDNVVNAWGWNEDFADSLAFIDDLRSRQPFITRMYSRVSGWEVNADPSFEEQGGGLVSNVHDLSDRDPVEVCWRPAPRTPCGSMYCGVGAECASTDEGEGCLCPEGTTARVITDPRVQATFTSNTVFCQDTSYDLMASVADMGLSGAGLDPCANFDCGPRGQCLAVNGFATCQCESGFAAVPEGDSTMFCAEVSESYGPEQLLWDALSGCGCSSSLATPNRAVWLLALLAFLPAIARRRRA